MVKTAISILVAFALVVGISLLEFHQMQTSFSLLESAFRSLYLKTERETATHEDGKVVKTLWEREKRTLHFWLPHAVVDSVDFQLEEAIGFLYEFDYQDALPKIEILIDLVKYLPTAYALRLENVF